MINRIIEFCADNKFIVLLIVGIATLVGWRSMRNITLDAIPDLSDTQVIIYSKWDRSPDIIEDQVTYPIISAMLGAPKVKDIRGFSDFGFSYVYIIFEDGTDIYWARSRTLEYLSNITPKLPQGVNVELARDETAVGAIWLLYYLNYNLSIAVWVGLIALLGVDAETGVFMLLYLDLAYDEMRAKGLMKTRAHLHEAIVHGAVKRLRPKFMTVAVDFIGLIPVMWATGAGSDLMKRIAAPMVAGMFTSFIMELVVYPAIYAIWKWRAEVRRHAALEPELMPATG